MGRRDKNKKPADSAANHSNPELAQDDRPVSLGVQQDPNAPELFDSLPAKAPIIGSRSQRSKRPAVPGLESANPTTQKATVDKPRKAQPERPSRSQPDYSDQPSNFIPEEVSIRMIRRVVLFSGIPTFLGLSSFGINYYLITRDIVQVPSYFTLLETGAFFGLGFLGITYGVLSASWEMDPGSPLGVGEFKTNLANLTAQWRQRSQEKRSQSSESEDED